MNFSYNRIKIIFFGCFAIFAHLGILPLVALPFIQSVGDSHSGEFKKIPNCKTNHIGPITMHRVGRDGLNIVNLKSLGIQDNQAVVFAFGEIDVRCHIGKQRDLCKRNLDEIIDSLAKKYIHTILLNRLNYNNLLCIVYSITPPTEQYRSPRFPYYGTLSDRIEITKKLNNALAKLCKINNIEFLDVFDNYSNADGSLNTKFADKSVHILPKYNKPIIKKLNKILQKNEAKNKLINEFEEPIIEEPIIEETIIEEPIIEEPIIEEAILKQE